MTNTVLLKRSNTANAVPLAGSLTAGELALNYTDGNLFYKNSSGVVTLLASNQQMSVFGNIAGGNILTSGIVSATSNITGGNILTAGIISATGNITGKYFLGNANVQYTASTAPATGNLIGAQWYNTSTDTLYEWQTDGTSTYWVDVTGPVVGVTGGATGNIIVNGTSNVTIPVANGNAGINVGGTANVAIFATTGAYFTGVASATGNITGGNLVANTTVNAVNDIIIGDTSNTTAQKIRLVTTGTNTYIQSGNGVSNSTGNIVFAPYLQTGTRLVMDVTNSAFSAAGNITGGNILTGNIVSATGNITAVANISGGNILTAGIVSSTGNALHGNLTVTGNATVTYAPASTVGTGILVNAANTIGGTGYADFLRATNTSTGATNPNKTFRLNSTGALEIINSAYDATLLTLDNGGNLILAGSLTMSSRPAFRVYGAGATTITATNTLTSSNFAVDYQQGSALNTSTGIFTAPYAGLYQINLIARYAGNAATSAIQVQKTSGVTVTQQVYLEWAGNSTAFHMGGASVTRLAVNDTLKVVVTSGSVTFDVNDSWSVAYIG